MGVASGYHRPAHLLSGALRLKQPHHITRAPPSYVFGEAVVCAVPANLICRPSCMCMSLCLFPAQTAMAIQPFMALQPRCSTITPLS